MEYRRLGWSLVGRLQKKRSSSDFFPSELNGPIFKMDQRLVNFPLEVFVEEQESPEFPSALAEPSPLLVSSGDTK